MKILLCGYMGAGKSYLLQNLPGSYAQRIDLDLDIERSHGPIDQIFLKKGEAFFRELEKEHLSKILRIDESPILVALGGGCLTPELISRREMDHFALLWLNTSFETCYQRIMQSQRPKARLTKEDLWQLYVKRQELYQQADWWLTAAEMTSIVDDRDLFEKMTRIMKGQIDEALRHRS